MCLRIQILQVSQHEILASSLQWGQMWHRCESDIQAAMEERPQGERQFRELLPRETTGIMQSQPRRVAVWDATSKAIELRLPKPVGVHILLQCAPYARAVGFNVCPSNLVWIWASLFLLLYFSLL